MEPIEWAKKNMCLALRKHNTNLALQPPAADQQLRMQANDLVLQPPAPDQQLWVQANELV